MFEHWKWSIVLGIGLLGSVLGTFAADDAVLKPLIVGGQPAEAEEYPWIVALLREGEDEARLRQFCGGVLIDPIWVLTAAHCVDDGLVGEDFEIVVGNNDLSMPYVPVFAQTVLLHPEYHPHRLNRGCDLALIRLSEPIEDAQVVSLNRASEILNVGNEFRALGWGGTDFDRSPFDAAPAQLQEVDLELADIAELYPEGHPAIRYFISTNSTNPPKGPYSGDSGSPLLFWSESDNEWVVAGVASSGLRGRSDFANLAPFVDWIDSVLRFANRPELAPSDRVMPNFELNGKKYVGFRTWPFAGPRAESIEFFERDLWDPRSYERWSPSYYSHWLDAGDGSFYILSELSSKGSAFARLEIENRWSYEAPILDLSPFDYTSLSARTQSGEENLRHYAFWLQNLEVGRRYRLGGSSILLFEGAPGKALLPVGPSSFLAREGHSYWAMTWTNSVDEVSLIPLPEHQLKLGTTFRGELTKTSPKYRREGTRVALFNLDGAIGSREVKITLTPEFDGEFTVYNYRGFPVAYADQGAEFEVDELIIDPFSLVGGSIAVHNFDADATGSFELLVSANPPANFTWNVEQYRGITQLDNFFYRDSSGRDFYYESMPLKNSSNYKYINVQVQGYNFEPSLIVTGNSGELARASGSRNLDVTAELEPNENVVIRVTSGTRNVAEYYRIIATGTNTDPRL